MLLSLKNQKVAKEYIYVKKHPVSMYSLEEVYAKFNKSKDKITEMVNFYAEKINYEKLRFCMKIMNGLDGKYKLNINQVKETVNELLINSIENFVNNSIDSTYVSENIVLTVSNYSGKHYISICPRLDFTK